MKQIERRDAGLLYIADKDALEQQACARRLTQRLNTMDRSDFESIQKAAAELLGASDCWVNPPFYCDYGFNISVGRNFYANYNCTIVDVARVSIGNDCFLGPGVSIYTAGHPVHPAARNTQFEYGRPVSIGDNVWIGGASVICPGVTIGSNSVIGAGSVVTHDVPPWVVAAGNPCRALREITEADRERAFHGEPIDSETLAEMRRIWDGAQDPSRFPTQNDA